MTTKNRVEDNRLNYCKNCGEILQENQDFCPNCGVHAGNGNRYCDNCGAEVAADAAFCPNCGTALKSNQTYGKPVTGTLVSEEAAAKVQPRSLVTAIILSLVTCGIYGIYWFIVMTDELNLLTDNKKDLSGGLAFVLSLVTCGIYTIIWAYRMGQKVDKLNGTKDGNNGIIYLILTLLGFGIIAYVLIQDSMNKALENR